MDITTISRAMREAHAGQVDKRGRDYYQAHLVPISEACIVFGHAAEVGGLVHDFLEDTGGTRQDLLDFGCTQFVVDATDSVTRRPGEAYRGRPESLIARSCAHPLGVLIKIVDNAWNILCNADLARTDPVMAESLLHDRYLPARGDLLAAAKIPALQMHKVEMILRDHHSRLSRLTRT